ncbi:hypothetical protein CMV_018816 [Castanea mollissima]|uniref:Aminotransferase-like plant mobile domain-containing protein n=1 Tax=Castanea mollissima TaxID=60419 RepID=A0A8J4R429_9ROSI|nr:hypothetical protein CMV_018816 [Castanea mollissima]
MEPRIDDEPQILHPGPLDESLLTRQRYHRSEDIWNGEDLGPLTCRGRTKEMASIQMGDNRYWAWARLPFLCPRIEPPPGCDYGPWPYAPLAFKWVRVPSSKSRPSGMALIHYREQLVRMQPDQIVWQPYEADFGHLPDFCVAGRDTWTARANSRRLERFKHNPGLEGILSWIKWTNDHDGCICSRFTSWTGPC